MARYTIPLSPDTDDLLAQFDQAGKNSMRFEDLVSTDSLQARRALDELVLEGKVARFPVGNYIMVRDLREDPTREKGWPHADHAEDVTVTEDATDVEDTDQQVCIPLLLQE